jgi:hypothetical protein
VTVALWRLLPCLLLRLRLVLFLRLRLPCRLRRLLLQPAGSDWHVTAPRGPAAPAAPAAACVSA